MGKEKKENRETRELIIPAASVSLSDDFIKTENNARTINDFSTGLSFAIPDKEILCSYNIALESQRSTLDSIVQIGEKFKMENDKFVSVVNQTAFPLASTLVDISKDATRGFDSVLEAFKIKNDQLTYLINTAVLPISNAVADIGLANANATKLFSLGSIDVKQFQLTQNISGLALETVRGYQDVFGETLTRITKSGLLKHNEIVESSLSVVGCGISEVMQSLPVFPVYSGIILPSLKVKKELSKYTSEEISNHQVELDKLLFEIDPELVELRKAVWETFNKKGKDYIGQASSSMRRLVDNLIRAMAPREEVVKTDYFNTDKEAKDNNENPTRRARCLYLVNWDESKAEHLRRVVTGFLEAYGNLSAWDHAPIKKHGFAHGTFITIEGYLISILSVNKE